MRWITKENVIVIGYILTGLRASDKHYGINQLISKSTSQLPLPLLGTKDHTQLTVFKMYANLGTKYRTEGPTVVYLEIFL